MCVDSWMKRGREEDEKSSAGSDGIRCRDDFHSLNYRIVLYYYYYPDLGDIFLFLLNRQTDRRINAGLLESPFTRSLAG